MSTYDPFYRVRVNNSDSAQRFDCDTSTYFLYYITVSTYCQDVVLYTTYYLSLHYSYSAALGSGVR